MRRLALLRFALPFGVLPLALVLGGCSLIRSNDGGDECVCTLEFRTVTVRVVDAAGQPVPGLDVTVTNERTGAVLDVDQANVAPNEQGVYAVVTDGEVNDVSEAGDPLRFRAEGGGRTAEATFVVGRDACACHIDKRSGPEEVTAR